MERHAFRAMGTDVEVLLDLEPGPEATLALASVEAEFERLEALFSRFRLDSELSRLNEAGSVEASAELLAVVRLALDARERTHGRFDPTVHEALVAAGYDRSFELIGRAAVRRAAAKTRGEVSIRRGRIELEPGVRLDLGGIAKGYAADQSVSQLAALGPCLVNAGGDLAVAGAPRGGSWTVGVDTPVGTVSLGLERGAIATSGSDRRRWQTGDKVVHHLIDPETGLPADSDLLRVTVVASSAVEAEVLAKALYLVGEEAAVLDADSQGIPSILLTIDGRVRWAGGLS